MKKLLLASAAAFAMGGMAYAAEPLAPIAPPLPPMVEPFFVPTWAGPYIGADIGWGWADIDRHRRHRFHTPDGFFDVVVGSDSGDLDGLVGGVFAGWLGQSGNFLYGVELFAQLADIDGGGTADRLRLRFADGFEEFRRDDDRFSVIAGSCFFDGDPVPCQFSDVKVHALLGLEGMIGWGGERTAFLLRAGPALGWFQDDTTFLVPGARHTEIDETEFGLSVAAEGRFKLTERIFAGVIGRAFWFPDVDVGRRDFVLDVNNGVQTLTTRSHKDDVTVFEVKARLGVMFGQPPAAAPVQAAF